MSLPSSRNTTYAPSSPILSADLNSIQDQIVGGKHGARTIEIAAWAFHPVGFSATLHAATGSMEGVSFAAWGALSLPQGTRLTALRFYVRDSVTGPTKMVAQFGSNGRAGTGGLIGSAGPTAGTGADQTLTITPTPTVITAGTTYWMNCTFQTGAGTCRLYGAELDIDRL